MQPLQKQMLDDVFDAYSMLSRGSIVSVMHIQGNTTRWSPAGVELFGLSGEYIPNGSMDWGDYVHPEDRKRYLDAMIPLTNGSSQSYDITYRVRTVSGEYGIFRNIGGVLRDANGEASIVGGILVNQGLTDNTDPVTVLPNKNSFLEDIDRMMKSGKRFFALQAGISRLSEINRVHGYSFGNRVLQETAWLIQETIRNRGRVYRMADAKFAVISDTFTRDEIGAIYDHIRYQLQRGIQVNGIKNILSANGGLISVSGADSDAPAVLSCLDYAYEESKQHKHGDLVDFNGSINYDGHRTLEMLAEIRASITNEFKGFSVEYNPVTDAKTEHLNGAEVTVFWNDEKYGKVDSGAFIPILERDFIFEELGDHIIQKSLSDGVEFLKYDPGFLLCINVYRIQLESGYFIDSLLYYLRETGFPSHLLSLKFDSDCRFIGIERMRNIIDKLHEHHILTIIGDFGSGTDSISFLKSEPIDAVSISSSFIKNADKNRRDLEILSHLIGIASTCVRHINVTGVDTKELLDSIAGMPFTTMQGRCYSDVLTSGALIEKYYSRK